jgi:hypothetical protein
MKKSTSSVRFWFYKPKTEPNSNLKKTESNRKNQAKPI